MRGRRLAAPEPPQRPAGPCRPLLAADEDPAPAGEAFVASIHETVRRLVALDVRVGGNEAARQAEPALSAVRRRICTGSYRRHAKRDLYAAAAELFELSGWLLCDANRQAAAWRMNRAAISLARRCGHRSIELFVLHNMSLQATYLRRPRDAMDLVRPVIEQSRLTARLSAMFQLRLARAYAQMGLPEDAFRTLGRAYSLLLDGVSERDPAWCWWVSERGFRFASAAMHGTLGQWPEAVDPLWQVLEHTPDHAVRDRFLYLCVLLHAQVQVGSWREGRSTAEHLAGLVGVVGSDRPLARLTATVEHLPASGTPTHRLAEAVDPVRTAVRALATQSPRTSGGPASTGEDAGP